jgi:CheY-like chemotaxis protein
MNKTVVIADGELSSRSILKAQIDKCGFDPVLFDDGFEMIKYMNVHHHEVAALFIDIHVQGVDGISALGQFRSKYPLLPVIMMTASDDPDDELSVRELGAAGFIKKPFPAEISQVIEGYLKAA